MTTRTLSVSAGDKIAGSVIATAVLLLCALLLWKFGGPEVQGMAATTFAIAIATAVYLGGRIVEPRGAPFVAYAMLGTIALLAAMFVLSVLGLSALGTVTGLAGMGTMLGTAFVAIIFDDGTPGIVE